MTSIFARGRALKARRISQVGNDRESRHARATAFLGHMPSNMPSDAPAGSWTRAGIMPMNGPGQRRRDHAVGYAGGIVDARPDERTGATRGRRAGIMPMNGPGQFVDARPDIVDGGAGVMPMNGPGQLVDERTGATSGSCRRMVRGNSWTNGPRQRRRDHAVGWSGRVGVMPMNGPGQLVDGGAGVMPMNGPGQLVDEARGSCRRAGVMKIFRTARGAFSEGARHDREKGISYNLYGVPDSCRHFPQSPGRIDEGRIMETANGGGIVLSEAIDGPRARVRVLPVSLTGDRIW